MPRPGQLALTLVALMTSLGPFIADFNESHVYNPRWMPHAKFHNGQTMSMGALLGLLTLVYTWGDAAPPLRRERLRFAVVLASLYWVTQLMAWFYPGALAVDPPGDVSALVAGGGAGADGGQPGRFPQFWISGAGLSLTGLGWWLETRRVKG